MSEQTSLSPDDERRFRSWVAANAIPDVDNPEAHYDYRGYWKRTQGVAHTPGEHFPDTFKQHGHPTFSVESQYSKGPNDGGRWSGDSFVPAGADLLSTSRRGTDPNQLAEALRLLSQVIK